MKIIDTSSWVMHHYRYNTSLSQCFQALLAKDPSKTEKEWFAFLMNQGMVPVEDNKKKDWLFWRRDVDKLVLSECLTELQQEFEGPDTDVFLFPLNTGNKVIMEELDGKNGHTFPDFILAFWKTGLEEGAVKALLIHEYHHLARMFHQNSSEHQMSLLESMVMEGLAEREVKSRLGESFLAPWTKRYSDRELAQWWSGAYKKQYRLKGRNRHAWLLYGGVNGIPPLMGYQLGYSIVEAYTAHHPSATSLELLKASAETLLEPSYAK